MTYEAEVQFKFDATYTPTYGSGFSMDDFIPEEHYVITAPAADLNAKQYFKLFEKFMLCVGMDPKSIRSGAMSDRKSTRLNSSHSQQSRMPSSA